MGLSSSLVGFHHCGLYATVMNLISAHTQAKIIVMRPSLNRLSPTDSYSCSLQPPAMVVPSQPVRKTCFIVPQITKVRISILLTCTVQTCSLRHLVPLLFSVVRSLGFRLAWDASSPIPPLPLWPGRGRELHLCDWRKGAQRRRATLGLRHVL